MKKAFRVHSMKRMLFTVSCLMAFWKLEKKLEKYHSWRGPENDLRTPRRNFSQRPL